MQESIYSPDYIKRLFNGMSKSYERVNYLTSFGFSLLWRKQFLSDFAATNDRVEVIDLLTGMGETWAVVLHKLPNATITALDFSTGMLQQATHKNKAHFDGKIHILQQDILENNLPTDYFDFVVCAFGLKTFTDEQLKSVAATTQRILKKGGQASFIEISVPENRVLNAFYSFYLSAVIPVLGKVLLGNPIEYKMLWQYTQTFKNAQNAALIFADTGLQLKYKRYFLGCATGFVAQK